MPMVQLYDAARRGSAAEVAALLAGGAKLNEPVTGGVTPLYIASEKGHTKVVTRLLAANANVNQGEGGGVRVRQRRR